MITSTGSSQVKHILLLQKKSKARKEYQEFVVEGAKMVLEAPKDRVVKVYASETYSINNKEILEGLALGQEKLELVSDNVFVHMSDTRTPQGIMAVIKMRRYNIEEIISDKALIIGVENLQDPGNLGTIVRMGEGAGVTGIVMSSGTADIYNPKTIRSTMGSIYRVPFIYADNFVEALKILKNSGVCVYAAHLKSQFNYTEPDYTKATAFLIGNEGNGLTEAAAATADTLVKIPMEGSVESLNAAIACTVLTYEALRQRR